MCVGNGCMKIHKFGATIPFNEFDVPTVDILDVTPEQLKKQWDLIPGMCKIDQLNDFNPSRGVLTRNPRLMSPSNPWKSQSQRKHVNPSLILATRRKQRQATRV